MVGKRGTTRPQRETIRCAIYTRKSTEEGLEQEFNSLDAQREACSAYILSQRHAGWVELPQPYDDGGFSGGTMERPSLKQLLADIEAGKVDVIVLYKVDRLTRSLADFARIVEVLDKAGASFVSVTQAFNTTTSMGRLTLNVLLSFAQFEREVTGERIRDKVAASKAKGMWMGGVVPLGYQLGERRLLIHEGDAATVRTIFERYAELGSVGDLADELYRRGIVSKVRKLANGAVYGGRPFTRGALAHLIKNRIYVGEVEHRGNVYPGEQPAIIDRELWERVQGLLADHRRERTTSLGAAKDPSVLAGMISDGNGRPMTPSHATKGARRYRYYVSRSSPDDPHRPWRLPARTIEQLVVAALSQAVGDGGLFNERLLNASGEALELVRRRCSELAARISKSTPAAVRAMLDQMAVQVRVENERVLIGWGANAALEAVLGTDASRLKLELTTVEPFELVVPVLMQRRGQELRLVFRPSGMGAPGAVDATLVQLLARAHEAHEVLLGDQHAAPPAGKPHLTRLARLRYLAPDIVSAILDGRQPADLSARKLLRVAPLPACWRAQRQVLGFG